MTEREFVDLVIGQAEVRIENLARLMQIYWGVVAELRDALRRTVPLDQALAQVETNAKMTADECRQLRTFVESLGNRPGELTQAEHNRLAFLKRQVERGEVTEW